MVIANQASHEPRQIGEICAEWLSGMVERMDLRRKRELIFNTISQDDERKWSAIRALYKTIDTSVYDPYPVDWMQIFSPIEDITWGEIRYNNLPFWPQFPISRYFADFANPVKKIVIECDGREFHSYDKDRKRDLLMAENGWTVYRISGADCNRVISSPWERISDSGISKDDPQARQWIREWLNTTVDGFIAAISTIYFAKPIDRSEMFRQEAIDALSRKCSRKF